MITVLFTDGDLVPLGQPLVRFKKLECTLRFNEPDSTVLTVPALPEYLEMAQPGNRLAVIRSVAGESEILTSGPIEYPALLSWSADSSADDGEPGLLTVAATDDSVRLAHRLVYPNPAQTADAQTADFYTLTSTNAEVAMRAMVNLNAIAGSALTARAVPRLILGSLASVGTNINVRSRFDLLADQLRTAAIAGGGLGFRVIQDGDDLKFEVYAPTDRTGTVRFSRGLGNLRSFTYQSQAPGATVAIVGGDGTGSTRTIVEREDTAATAIWDRIETFVGDSSAVTADLNQSGDAELAQAAEQAQVTALAIDTATQRFGTHYRLGDKVAIEIYPGLQLVDVVRAVTLTVTKDGEVIQPQIGTASMTADSQLVRQVRALGVRLARQERT
jgi:hypothetical protein